MPQKLPYKGILLDLFWTVVDVDYAQFPSVKISRDDGLHKVYSDVDLLFREVQKDHSDLDREIFRQIFFEKRKKIREDWDAGILEEISSLDKFVHFIESLNIFEEHEGSRIADLAQRLTDIHMRCIVESTVIPDDRKQMLASLSQQYPLALVSNFDHAPAGYEILALHELKSFFKAVVISDDLGKRKPHPELFLEALQALGIRPEEALMVGDSPLPDIHGAAQVGIDTAWIKRPEIPWPKDLGDPTYALEDLRDLGELLKITGNT